jgi:hypothetical protein
LKKSLAGGTACPTLLQVLNLQWWRRRFRLRFGGAEDFFSTLLRAGSQFFRSTKPVLLRRSFRATSCLPEFIGSRRDLMVSERSDAMRGLHGVPMSGFGVLQRLPRPFPACQVILLSMLLLGTAVGVRGDVMEFRRALVIFIMRPVVIACGHKLETHNLSGLGVGFLGQFISTLRVFQRALIMPVPGLVIPFFVMLGSRAMGVCRPFVFFGRSSVQIVHICSSKGICLLDSTIIANPASLARLADTAGCCRARSRQGGF